MRWRSTLSRHKTRNDLQIISDRKRSQQKNGEKTNMEEGGGWCGAETRAMEMEVIGWIIINVGGVCSHFVLFFLFCFVIGWNLKCLFRQSCRGMSAWWIWCETIFTLVKLCQKQNNNSTELTRAEARAKSPMPLQIKWKYKNLWGWQRLLFSLSHFFHFFFIIVVLLLFLYA